MKLSAIVITAAAAASPVSQADEPQDMPLVVPAAIVAKCQAEGGCALFSREYIEQLHEKALQAETACWRSRKET